ncbi:OsmC domain protein [Natronomonas pharaonis DSM 2160]|uniref:OsmC domain protein n=1 Tax=Natronomonas pharaonis (strain ATCC 35678 / DSM 2160 / CIP 103997 / JCM 8858 / NBRC 14720 / NCIMB 2260 / Gabara) TaxID=348780 RepID=A0A1U7EWK9_NATPD|nr:OsmC family protein [Natronomonas pharaonis]CAI49475.1 OsmC domain protein [Natronomonas pharaonis DSM 2160]
MSDIETTTINEEKYHAFSRAGEFELSIDASGNDGPSPNEVLVADYASCFTFACRAGAKRRLEVDLGKVETEAEADLDDSDDIEAIRFHLFIEAALTDEQLESVIELGEEICHVHAVLDSAVHADVEATANAF